MPKINLSFLSKNTNPDILKPYNAERSEIVPEAAALSKLADLPFLSHNTVDLLVDGEAFFGSLTEGLKAAKEYILFQFYIVKNDEIGSYGLSDTYKIDLKNAGIAVYSFHTQKGKGNRFQLNFRNHRKVVVVDGKSAWIGGLNVGGMSIWEKTKRSATGAIPI